MAITPQSQAYLCAIAKIVDPGSDEEHLKILAALKAHKAAAKVHARLAKALAGLPLLAKECQVHSVLPMKGDGLFAAIAAFNHGSAQLSTALNSRDDRLGYVLQCLQDQLWIPSVSRLLDGAEKTIKAVTSAAENFHGNSLGKLESCRKLLEECKALHLATCYQEACKKIEAIQKEISACSESSVPIKTLQKIFSLEQMTTLETMISAAVNEAKQFETARNSGLMDLKARLETIKQEREFALSLVNESFWKKHTVISAVCLLPVLIFHDWQCFAPSLWNFVFAIACNIIGSRKLVSIQPPIRYTDEKALNWALYPAVFLSVIQVVWSLVLGIKSLFSSLNPGWFDPLFPQSVAAWFGFLVMAPLGMSAAWNAGAGLYYRSVSKGARGQLEKLDREKLELEQKISAL